MIYFVFMFFSFETPIKESIMNRLSIGRRMIPRNFHSLRCASGAFLLGPNRLYGKNIHKGPIRYGTSLHSEEGESMMLMAACPGFTKTGIDRNAPDWDGLKTLHPQSTLGRVADPWETEGVIIHGARHNHPPVIHFTVGRITHLVMKIAPWLYERLMARSLRSELERHDNP
jgi:hypothetical protein